MIIDFHTHCFPEKVAKKAVLALSEKAGIPARLDGTVRDLKQSMKRANIDISILQPIATKPSQTESINNWAIAVSDKSIISFGSIHPKYDDWKNELFRIKESGLKGIKLHPDYQEFFVDDENMYPVYEAASDLNLIILFHAGVDIGLPAPFHCTPKRLSKIMDMFPQLRIVAAHMGSFKYWDDVEGYLLGRDIYLDTSFSLGHITEEQFVRIVNNHNHTKILFGSDSPWTDQSEEIQKIHNLGINNKVLESIMGDNAEKLLV